MSFLSIESFAELLVREWSKLYRLAPRATVLGTIFFGIALTSIVYLTEQRSAVKREAKRLENQNYSSQVKKLDETRSNLQALLKFVEEERSNLRFSEQSLLSLKKEHEQLKPVVDADRKTIDALFSAQEARNQAAQNVERWIGFTLGVISSLVASFFWAVIAHARRRRSGDAAT